MLAISTEMHLITHSVILSGWINIAEVVAENMSIWQQGWMLYLELLPRTVSCPCTERERMPPWLSFVRGAGAWSSAAPVLERAKLIRSCKGKARRLSWVPATELVAKNNGGEAEQAPRCLPMVGIRARQRPERLEGEQENTPGDERGTGKLA